jgi:hypothetical protein
MISSPLSPPEDDPPSSPVSDPSDISVDEDEFPPGLPLRKEDPLPPRDPDPEDELGFLSLNLSPEDPGTLPVSVGGCVSLSVIFPLSSSSTSVEPVGLEGVDSLFVICFLSFFIPSSFSVASAIYNPAGKLSGL